MVKKVKNPKKFGDIVLKPQPLADQIIQENVAAPSNRTKLRTGRKDGDDEYVEGTLGRSIMQQSLAQMKEIDEDEEEWPALGAPIKKRKEEKFEISLTQRGFKKKVPNRKTPIEEHSDSDDDNTMSEMDNAVPLNSDKVVKEFEDELCIESGDLKVLEHFMKKDGDPQRRLCDIFRDKITEKQTELQTEIDAESVMDCKLSPALMKACHDISIILSRYRTGKLPKVFKSFPKMRCWEELLYRTHPEKWTAAAMYQVTRLFVSNLRASMAQRFCHLVLLPRVRDDIAFYKRLNFHLYQALIKALFKPSAFFKGIVLPLCEGGSCTLREAILIGSVIAKNHVPLTFSAAAIVKIASMEYSGANSIFLRILFDKKYALPYQVLDECVEHFKRFNRETRILPVLWHQSLLSFVQRYKNDISSEQKQDILMLTQSQRHHKITPQIHRELESSKCRELMETE